MEDRFELGGVDSFPVVPNSVVLGISLEQLCRLLEQFWREIAVTDLEQTFQLASQMPTYVGTDLCVHSLYEFSISFDLPCLSDTGFSRLCFLCCDARNSVLGLTYQHFQDSWSMSSKSAFYAHLPSRGLTVDMAVLPFREFRVGLCCKVKPVGERKGKKANQVSQRDDGGQLSHPFPLLSLSGDFTRRQQISTGWVSGYFVQHNFRQSFLLMKDEG